MDFGCKEISQEAIERKLKEAEERRMVILCKRQHNLDQSPKKKMDDLAFDVIVKPAACKLSPIIKSFLPCKEISQEVIERKLKEAEERRMSSDEDGEESKGSLVDGDGGIIKKLRYDKAKPSRVLLLSGLPKDVAEGEVIRLGLRFGPMTNVLVTRKKSQALLEMADISTAESMLKYYVERPPEIRSHAVHFQFSTLVNLMTDRSRAQNAGAQAALQVADQMIGSNEETRTVLRVDIENMPSGSEQPQQKLDPDEVKTELLGAFGSAFRGTMAVQPMLLDNLMAVGELFVAGGDGDGTIPMTNFDSHISDELKDADEVGTNEANDQPDYSDNKDQRDETKEVAAEAFDPNDNLEDVEDGAGGGGPPSSHSDEGDDPEDLLNTHLNNLIEIHNLMLQMPQLTNGITKNRNSCPILFWGSPDVSDFVLKFFDDEMTLNHLHAEIIPDLPTSTQALINAAAERCVASAPSFFVILGLGETREHDQVVLDRLESFAAGGHAVTVVATATDIGDMDGTAIRLKFPAIHVPVVFNVEPLVNQPQE